MALVILPYMYIPDPTRGRPVFNGKIYIGEVDTDPRIESNQKAALLVQEDGSRVEAEYPIQINSGGVPTYNGSPVAIDVTGEYAIAIDSKDDQQVYYFARAGTDAENLTTDLRSVMFDFGLLYEDIGSKLVSSSAGTLLDEARLILDINSGRVLDLPTSIPIGSVVVSLTDFTLVTNNGQFTLNQAWSNTVENRFKGNQNWNVEGSTGDPLPGVTPTLYTVGAEIVAGVEVITTNADQITYVAGVLNSGNNTGILRRRYAKDVAGLITKTSQYGGIKLPDGSQLQALVDDIAANGVRITEDGSDVVVDVDLSVVTGGFRFFGLSDERGAWTSINEDESFISQTLKDVIFDAWVAFDDTGTILDSFNFASVAVNGTSDYTATFENEIPTPYCVFTTMSINAVSAGSSLSPVDSGILSTSIRVADARGNGPVARPYNFIGIVKRG